MKRTTSGLLIGDGIENPANALTMIQAAAMFAVECRFRDTKGLAAELAAPGPSALGITTPEMHALDRQLIACDNLPGARDVYGFRASRDYAVLLGNERRGLSREIASLAHDRIEIPMVSRRINCLNVAAASAVALYYLTAPPVGDMAARRHPQSRRPELLLVRPRDQFEAGSTLRSAAAFGFQRAFLDDEHAVWFSRDRVVRSEGRAAARRGRNDILVVPCPRQTAFSHARVTIVTRHREGLPLHRANLAGGSQQLVVIADESQFDATAEDWSRLGAPVDFAHLQLPVTDFAYHFRLVASIALAEISRQVGRRQELGARRGERRPIYDHGLAELAQAAGEWASFTELLDY